ncbi:acyl-coa desaturase [Holotrichia oblita]|uniref:Acyl-coa desaturase n=1 Tax=Holotrichia oblita TaxID=644536 RepID=A0ACB9SZA7_HOLOL|nr:acyl-coa desaturase [Holotrichia oblita]
MERYYCVNRCIMTEGRDEVPNGDVCATSQQNGNAHHLEGKTRTNKNLDASEKKSENEKFIPRIKWPDLAAQLFIHIGCAYGLYLCFYSRFYTSLFDHRVHHKYTESDADPHNAKRGFWFSHVGWLILTPHPDVVAKRIAVDMSDLEADPIVMWQKNVAHLWGQKPYDRYINSVENLAVSVAALGEGWHNFHHVFPWDYKTGEFGTRCNLSTQFIDFFAWLGWAYDLKSATPEVIHNRVKRCGDGTHPWAHDEEALKEMGLVESKKDN